MFVLMLSTLTLSPPARSQDKAVRQQMNACIENWNARTVAAQNKQWEQLVSLAREYISRCLQFSPETRIQGEATSLTDIATGLQQQGKDEEVIPITNRCVAIQPDAVECWALMGQSFEGLGKLSDARRAYEQAIGIGGYTERNAQVIEVVRQELAQLDQIEKALQKPKAGPAPSVNESKKFGTGFLVSGQGHILTNNHVVAGCRTLSTRDGKPLQVVSKNPSSDLALLQTNYTPNVFAVFRTGPTPKLGDDVVAFGFPLPGVLSSEGNVSAGILSATSGIENDVRFVQISAPVQPGNSGGPLFDSSGHVIGVVVAKLDAVKVAQLTGDVPQNVNFAVHWAEVRAFLDDAGVPYRKEVSQRPTTTRSIAALATQISVSIECTP